MQAYYSKDFFGWARVIAYSHLNKMGDQNKKVIFTFNKYEIEVLCYCTAINKLVTSPHRLNKMVFKGLQEMEVSHTLH